MWECNPSGLPCPIVLLFRNTLYTDKTHCCICVKGEGFHLPVHNAHLYNAHLYIDVSIEFLKIVVM